MSGKSRDRSAIVVGGSLAGLCAAIRLASDGIGVTVVERSTTLGVAGGGLGVSRRQLSRVIGVSAHGDGTTPALPVIDTRREAVAWTGLHGWLSQIAARSGLIEIVGGQTVIEVASETDHASVRTGERTLAADFVVGADGYNSTVRRFVAPDHADASFAGYVLWRGLISEQALPAGTMPDEPRDTTAEWAGRHRLVAYQVPGEHGGTGPVDRRVNWAWYDADRTPLLRSLGIIDADRVVRSLSSAEMPVDVSDDLVLAADRLWSEPWRTAIKASLRAGLVFGTPIAEYAPTRLVRGRIALVGDAAHVSTPMVGTGFGYGLDDVDALSRSISQGARGVEHSLSSYQRTRLGPDRALALEGMSASRSFLAHVRRRPAAIAK